MEELVRLLSRRTTTILGGRRRVMALVLVSVAAAAAAWITWQWTRGSGSDSDNNTNGSGDGSDNNDGSGDREPLVTATSAAESPGPLQPKLVRFAPTVRVRVFDNAEIVDDTSRWTSRKSGTRSRQPKPILKTTS